MNFLQLPVEVLPHVRRLSAVQLAIWADAWTWAKQGAKAYRTNDQLAEMFGCTVKSVSKAIAGLKAAGLIDSRMVNGRQRILTATIPSNVHPPERPSSSTSILSNVHAASPSTSTLHPPERPPCIPSNVHQVEKVVEQIVEKKVEKRASQPKIEIVMPWESDEFASAWREWKEYKRVEKRFTFKSPKTEQTALHKIHQDAEGNEHLAVFAIATSIANGWAGIFINAQLKREFSKREGSRGSDELTPEYLHWVKTGEWLPHSV
jgi:biotin operon repressor